MAADKITSLRSDLKNAAKLLSHEEARYLVDLYYQMQEFRKGAGNEIGALKRGNEPQSAILNWVFGEAEVIENEIKRALDKYTDTQPMGIWSKSIVGVGPVIAAGLLANIDLTKCKTAGSIWRFAGLDPSVTWGKGQKRPWNARLKTLCCLPETRITTKRGHIPIAEINLSDEVLTHKGRWRKVTQVFTNYHTGLIYGLRAANSGNATAWLTGGHPVMASAVSTWRSGRTFKPNEKTRREFDWLPIESIQPRYKLLRPIVEEKITAVPKLLFEGVGDDGRVAAVGRWSGVAAPRARSIPQEISLDPVMMRLIGLYLSEGHVTGNYIGWSFHENEVELQSFVTNTVREYFGIEAFFNKNQKNKCIQVMIGCKPMADSFAAAFGKGSLDMSFPMEWLSLPDELLRPLWQGIMDGDGDHVGKLAARRISSGNQNLARQIVDLGRRLGISVAIHSEKTGKAFRMMVNARRDAEVSARALLTTEYQGQVWNIEVDEDHSYVAEGFAVHNCWKTGESFVKVSGNPKSLYGKLYLERKAIETANNEALKYKPQADKILATKAIGKTTEAYKAYSVGKLPPAQIHERAKRWAVKIFLAHYWEHGCRTVLKREPPLLYAHAMLGHVHYIPAEGEAAELARVSNAKG